MNTFDARTLAIIADFLVMPRPSHEAHVEWWDSYYIQFADVCSWRTCCLSVYDVIVFHPDTCERFHDHCIRLNSFYRHVYHLDVDCD